jgi:hypothetical protein
MTPKEKALDILRHALLSVALDANGAYREARSAAENGGKNMEATLQRLEAELREVKVIAGAYRYAKENLK